MGMIRRLTVIVIPCFFSRKVFSMLILFGVAFSMCERMMSMLDSMPTARPFSSTTGTFLQPVPEQDP